MSEPIYFKPSVTADVLVLRIENGPEILLILRGRDPFAGHWALPGGFIEANETLMASAQRELQEETGLIVPEMTFFGVYGDPGRDPRGRTITMAYRALLPPGTASDVSGQDDAHDARWFSIHQLPELAFDHAQIVQDGLADLRAQLSDRYPGSRQLPEGFDTPHAHQLQSWLNL